MIYKVIKSDRQTMELEVKEGKVTVRAPRKTRRKEIKIFVNENKEWIRQKLKEFPKGTNGKVLTKEELEDLMNQARAVIPQRVREYASILGVDYNRVTIRHQKTRWGSCSGKKNLNFNCLLLLTPIEVMDSVIIHELCHLKYMNHSREFYDELCRVYPNYEQCNKWLKANGAAIIRRLPRK